MFLFIGVFPRERELAVVSFLCEYCRTPATQRVIEIGSRLWLFFIPLFTFSRRYFVVCSNCGGTTELTREQATNAADWAARNRQAG
jgi:zinc-ribbon family